MSFDPNLDLFCKVQDGKIIEFGVLRLHIKNRFEPLNWYLPVVVSDKPDITKFETLDELYFIGHDNVQLLYKKRNKTYNELYRTYTYTVYDENESKDKSIIDEDPLLKEKLLDLMFIETKNKLNSIAKSYGYNDGIDSMCTFVTSANLKYKTEASIANKFRDDSYELLEVAVDEIKKGVRPLYENIEVLFDDLKINDYYKTTQEEII